MITINNFITFNDREIYYQEEYCFLQGKCNIWLTRTFEIWSQSLQFNLNIFFK